MRQRASAPRRPRVAPREAPGAPAHRARRRGGGRRALRTAGPPLAAVLGSLLALAAPAAAQPASPEVCAGERLWQATHPEARRHLAPPAEYERRYEQDPTLRPQEGELRFSGLIDDGGQACGHPLRTGVAPPASSREIADARQKGEDMRRYMQGMSEEEMAELGRRMAERMNRGGGSDVSGAMEALAEDRGVDSIMDPGTSVHLFSPNALSWQASAGPPRSGPLPGPAPGAAVGAPGGDQPVVPYRHDGAGGWSRNAGSDLFLSIPGAPPHELREGHRYEARATLRYSRGEGVMKGSRMNLDIRRAARVWQALEGWHEQLSNAPEGGPLTGTVEIVEAPFDGISGRFSLQGQALLHRAECPENPGLLPAVSEQCQEEQRRGRLEAAGSFFACRGIVEPPPPQEEWVQLDPPRHRILHMSREEFEEDTSAQHELFEMAKGVRERQEAFGRRLLEEQTGGGEVVSVLKRPTKEAFVKGVVDKVERNEYEEIGEMDDMVRGRFDLESGGDVHRLARHLLWEQRDYHVKLVALEMPRREVDVPECRCQGYGYPRYHVIVRDDRTGITHEWQIGTGAVSEVYELHGVDLPPGMDLDFEQGRIAADLHDVDYDLFRKGVKEHDEEHGENMYEELRLDEFGKMIDELSAAAACRSRDLADLEGRIRNVQDFAASRLQAVVDHYGLDQVREWYH